jgi:single-stranded-DNA-specific exonuclease
MEVAGIDLSRRLSATDVGFKIAPRLNAAGRMDVAQDVVELFTVRDADRARTLAERLNQLNADRQQEERRIMDDIVARLDADPATRESFCLVIDGDGWHRGVIGIAATRVVERYGRPALVCSRDESGEAHGSGRSIQAFHLLSALESCHQLFNRFGGHAHAVGFALPADRVPELRAALDTFARSRLTTADFEPAMSIDAELSLEQVTIDLYRALSDLEPFGMENPEPVFCDRRARLVSPARVMKEKHLKLRLAPSSFNGSGRALEAVAWRMAEKFVGAPAPSSAPVSDTAADSNQDSGSQLGSPAVRQFGNCSLSAGDFLDVAFRLDYNTHPDFGGGVQMVLLDIVRSATTVA